LARTLRRAQAIKQVASLPRTALRASSNASVENKDAYSEYYEKFRDQDNDIQQGQIYKRDMTMRLQDWLYRDHPTTDYPDYVDSNVPKPILSDKLYREPHISIDRPMYENMYANVIWDPIDPQPYATGANFLPFKESMKKLFTMFGFLGTLLILSYGYNKFLNPRYFTEKQFPNELGLMMGGSDASVVRK